MGHVYLDSIQELERENLKQIVVLGVILDPGMRLDPDLISGIC